MSDWNLHERAFPAYTVTNDGRWAIMGGIDEL